MLRNMLTVGPAKEKHKARKGCHLKVSSKDEESGQADAVCTQTMKQDFISQSDKVEMGDKVTKSSMMSHFVNQMHPVVQGEYVKQVKGALVFDLFYNVKVKVKCIRYPLVSAAGREKFYLVHLPAIVSIPLVAPKEEIRWQLTRNTRRERSEIEGGKKTKAD